MSNVAFFPFCLLTLVLVVVFFCFRIEGGFHQHQQGMSRDVELLLELIDREGGVLLCELASLYLVPLLVLTVDMSPGRGCVG